VRTYLGLSSTPRKRRACAAPKNQQPKPATAEAPAARENKGCGPSGSASLQPSRLLRELGVRVSCYTHEERRDVITRYMQKRGGRQGVNRAAAKVPSRQALAERRRRGAGGKFLSKEEEAQVQPVIFVSTFLGLHIAAVGWQGNIVMRSALPSSKFSKC
jgi:hypothetical protein